MTDNAPQVIVALDFHAEKPVWNLVDQLSPADCCLKVGKELFTACGPNLVRQLAAKNFKVFLDLKFHDIPNTVVHALQAARDLGVWMVNVHASGGTRMLEAARAALSGGESPLLIAVTVLTSMEQCDLSETGISGNLDEQVLLLADLAVSAGLDGVVCSAQEAQSLRHRFGREFCLVTPGIRTLTAGAGDQRRCVTPEDAIQMGADFLVIGRPITQAEDPCATLHAINKSIATIKH